jgi:hypothetical protein
MSFMSWVIGLFQQFTKVGRGGGVKYAMPSYAFGYSFAVWPKAKTLSRFP